MRHPGTKLAAILAGVLLAVYAQPAFAVVGETVYGLSGYSPTLGQEIVSITRSYDYNIDIPSHYFAMTLAGVPDGETGDYASAYAILINSSGDPIDPYSVLTEFNANAFADVTTKLSISRDGSIYRLSYNPDFWNSSVPYSTFDPLSGFGFSRKALDTGEALLTWTIPMNAIDGPFSWMGATFIENTNSEYGLDLVHMTGSTDAVPIPNALWLLGSGVVALIGLKRRKNINR